MKVEVVGKMFWGIGFFEIVLFFFRMICRFGEFDFRCFRKEGSLLFVNIKRMIEM